ncbi:DUF4190 domain-containing protein [Halobacillus salinarum]|uniref:DUF4190 domain-containing protein n=1 Tax=Halobacillus salinarum TaxID=2932257 RepID=A0ABY4ETX0_9BACI|nr:DUF4190 domain-containing protein [Halobacillus salinarum]UOQ45581.1 DUF4190 domain-containing protein [Halobacillus salinarum]
MEEQTTRLIVEKPEGNGLAVASLVLGIIGVVFGFIPFIGIFFGFLFWVLAIIFGFIGMKKDVKKGLAISGLIMGAFMFIYQIGFVTLLGIGASGY